MEKIKKFFSKNGMVSVIVLILLMSMQTCSKNRKITRLTKNYKQLEIQNDSLSKLIPTQENSILQQYKIEFNVYSKLNNEILLKYKDRQSQITELQQKTIVPSINDLSYKINELEK
jgi:hypothetical protein